MRSELRTESFREISRNIRDYGLKITKDYVIIIFVIMYGVLVARCLRLFSKKQFPNEILAFYLLIDGRLDSFALVACVKSARVTSERSCENIARSLSSQPEREGERIISRLLE